MSIFSFQTVADKCRGIARRIANLRRRVEFRDALRKVVDTPEGRLVFEQMLRDCHVTQPVFSPDPMETARNEGRRHLAMSYLSVLGQDNLYDLIAKLERERDEHQNNTQDTHE